MTNELDQIEANSPSREEKIQEFVIKLWRRSYPYDLCPCEDHTHQKEALELLDPYKIFDCFAFTLRCKWAPNVGGLWCWRHASKNGMCAFYKSWFHLSRPNPAWMGSDWNLDQRSPTLAKHQQVLANACRNTYCARIAVRATAEILETSKLKTCNDLVVEITTS